MRLFAIALTAVLVTTLPVLSGGGTVTSTEAGPTELTEETTIEMLDTMGIQPAGKRTVQVVEYTIPARRAVTYTPPPRQAAKDAAAESDTATEVASSGPLDPRESVRTCTTCHGLNGLAKIPTAPNMAGSSRAYLETQLKAFRSGKREHEVMSVIAEALSDEQIKATARWYSSLKVTVEVPE